MQYAAQPQQEKCAVLAVCNVTGLLDHGYLRMLQDASMVPAATQASVATPGQVHAQQASMALTGYSIHTLPTSG